MELWRKLSRNTEFNRSLITAPGKRPWPRQRRMQAPPLHSTFWTVPVADWSRIARRIRVPLGFAFAAFYVWSARPSCLSLAVGTMVAIPGILLRALASGHVKKNEELTTSGPYARTRN